MDDYTVLFAQARDRMPFSTPPGQTELVPRAPYEGTRMFRRPATSTTIPAAREAVTP